MGECAVVQDFDVGVIKGSFDGEVGIFPRAVRDSVRPGGGVMCSLEELEKLRESQGPLSVGERLYFT